MQWIGDAEPSPAGNARSRFREEVMMGEHDDGSGAGARGTLLLLDDDERFRRYTARAFRSLGFRVLEAPDAETVPTVPDEPIDLFVVDINLPGADGIQVLERLAAAPGGDVIVCSGEEPRVIETARRVATDRGLRVVDAIRKPVRMNVLERSVLNWAEARDGYWAGAGVDEDLVRRFRGSIDTGGLQPLFQPRVDAMSGAITSFEVFLRSPAWEEPGADLSRLVGRIGGAEQARGVFGRHVLASAIGLFDAIGERAERPTLTVNTAAGILSEPGFPDALRRLAEYHGVDPAQLTLEFEMDDVARVEQRIRATLGRLALAGFQVGIEVTTTDDAVFDSVVGLAASEVILPLDGGRFGFRSDWSRERLADLVETFHDRGLVVNASGVESLTQVPVLQEVGFDALQGTMTRVPMPLEEALAFAESWHAPRPPFVAEGDRPVRP
jgi:EAL domain-containing protein (putative c-di-GMP-specific phosphodiesterase class I)